MPVVDKFAETGLHDGQHALLENPDIVVNDFVIGTSSVPPFVLPPNVDVAGIREGWNEAAVTQLRAPAAMIMVQMCAENVAHVRRFDTRGCKAFDIRRIQLVKEWIHVRAPVTCARIDHEHVAVDYHDPALKDELALPVWTHEQGHEPVLVCFEQHTILCQRGHG